MSSPYRNNYTPYRRHVNAWEARQQARIRRYQWFDRHPVVAMTVYLFIMIPMTWAAFAVSPFMGVPFVIMTLATAIR